MLLVGQNHLLFCDFRQMFFEYMHKQPFVNDEVLFRRLIREYEDNPTVYEPFLKSFFTHENPIFRTKMRDVAMFICVNCISIRKFITKLTMECIWKTNIDEAVNKFLFIILYRNFDSANTVFEKIMSETDYKYQESMIIGVLNTLNENDFATHKKCVFQILFSITKKLNNEEIENLNRFLKDNKSLNIHEYLTFVVQKYKNSEVVDKIVLGFLEISHGFEKTELDMSVDILAKFLKSHSKNSYRNTVAKLEKENIVTPLILTMAKEKNRTKLELVFDSLQDDTAIIDELDKIKHFSTNQQMTQTMLKKIHILFSKNDAHRIRFGMSLAANSYHEKYENQTKNMKTRIINDIFRYAWSKIPVKSEEYTVNLVEIEIVLQLIQNLVKVNSDTRPLIIASEPKYISRLEAFYHDLAEHQIRTTEKQKKPLLCQLQALICNFLYWNNKGTPTCPSFRTNKTRFFGKQCIGKKLSNERQYISFTKRKNRYFLPSSKTQQ